MKKEKVTDCLEIDGISFPKGLVSCIAGRPSSGMSVIANLPTGFHVLCGGVVSFDTEPEAVAYCDSIECDLPIIVVMG